jgi:hypothetical protein
VIPGLFVENFYFCKVVFAKQRTILYLKKSLYMRKLFSIALFLCVFSGIYAQQPDFLFANNLKDTLSAKVDYAYAGTHILGTQVARKLLLLHETYTYVESGTLTAPGDKTIVKKPDIYYSIKKLNNYYKKAVKKGIIDQKQAAKNLTSAIDKSYSMFYEDTQKFEEYVRAQKKPEDIQKAFDQVKLY